MLRGVLTASPPRRKVVSRAVLELSSGPKPAAWSVSAMSTPGVRRCRRWSALSPASSNLPGKRQRTPRNTGQNGAMSDTKPEARLLVVEDEPNILELLSASLRLAGFEVATATGGMEALQAVQRHRPDLIVLDVMLPDLDGFDVARRLRSGDTRTPVLFLTAKDATEAKVTGLTVGGHPDLPLQQPRRPARPAAGGRRLRGRAGAGGRATRWLVLAGALVGFGFLAKQLQTL